jgi:hypothetical protein
VDRKVLLVALGSLAAGTIAALTFARPGVADPDLWGLMAMGRETLARGWPPTQDPFAYVPTRNPVIYHEWFSGVLFYLLLEHLGSWALKGLSVLLGVSAVGVALLTGGWRGTAKRKGWVLQCRLAKSKAAGFVTRLPL